MKNFVSRLHIRIYVLTDFIVIDKKRRKAGNDNKNVGNTNVGNWRQLRNFNFEAILCGNVTVFARNGAVLIADYTDFRRLFTTPYGLPHGRRKEEARRFFDTDLPHEIPLRYLTG